MSRRIALPAAAAVASLLFDLLLLDRGIVLEEEGVTVALAARVAEGQLLYRDAPINLGPLVYELFAFVFRFTGPSFLAARVVVALATATTAATIAVAARRAGAGRSSFLAPWLFVLLRPLAFPQWHVAYYSPVAMLLTLASLAALLGTTATAPVVLAGVLAGAAFVAKQNYGALALAGGLATFALGAGEPTRRFRACIVFVASSSLPVAATALLYASRGGLGDLFHGMIVFALQAQGGTFVVPRPPLVPTLLPDELFRSKLLYYLPPLVWELGFPRIGESWIWKQTGLVELLLKAAFVLPPLLPVLVLIRSNRMERPREARCLAVCALALVLLASYPTWDWSHQVYGVVATFPCVALLASSPGARRLFTGLLALLTLPALVVSLAARARYDTPVPGLDVRATADLARTMGRICEVLHAEGAEEALVLPYQPAVYTACGVRNPTRLDIFLPGFVDAPSREQAHAALDAGRLAVRFSKEYGHLPKFADTYPDLCERLAEPPVALIPGPGFEVTIHRPLPRAPR